MDIVLASQSPRRQELLKQMGLRYWVRTVDIDEHMDRQMAPWLLVETISREKAAACAALEGPEPLIIAADTVVSIDGRILGKPRSPAAAAEMLCVLSGREHIVYSGLTVRCGGQAFTEHEATSVRFRTLSAGEIERYVGTGEPMDKAGAYGIQGYGSVLVEGISGDYYNVVGLPVCRLARLLARFGVDPLALAAEKEQGT